MYTAITGTYENGELVLDEPPPTRQRVAVIVTFMDVQDQARPARRPGSLLRLGQAQGKAFGLPDDFNEPLGDLREYME